MAPPSLNFAPARHSRKGGGTRGDLRARAPSPPRCARVIVAEISAIGRCFSPSAQGGAVSGGADEPVVPDVLDFRRDNPSGLFCPPWLSFASVFDAEGQKSLLLRSLNPRLPSFRRMPESKRTGNSSVLDSGIRRNDDFWGQACPEWKGSRFFVWVGAVREPPLRVRYAPMRKKTRGQAQGPVGQPQGEAATTFSITSSTLRFLSGCASR